MLSKIYLALTFFVVLCGYGARAQVYGKKSFFDNTECVLKAGVNFQQITAPSITAGYMPGFVGGVSGQKHWGQFGVRLEGLISTSHFTTAAPIARDVPYYKGLDTVAKGSFSTTYFNIPLLFEYNLLDKVFFNIGAQYSYTASVHDNNGWYVRLFRGGSVLERNTFSGIVGADVVIIPRLRIGVRYVDGLSDINAHKLAYDAKAWTTGSLQCMLSFKLQKKKELNPLEEWRKKHKKELYR